MNKSLKYMALGLVVLGLALAWMAFVMSGNPAAGNEVKSQKQEAQATPKHRTVVASKPIAAGQFLAAEDVQVRELAQASASAFTEVSAVVGRTAAQDLAEGDAINNSSLLSGISGMLQLGERAVSIKVEESTAVGHKVQPGDWVDVLVVFRKDGQEVPETQARRLLERKRVLAYGTQTEPARASVAPKDKEKDSIKSDTAAEQIRANNPARTAVLAVQMNEVNPLMLAERQGQVMLALRSPLEPAAASLAPTKQEAMPIVPTAEATAPSSSMVLPAANQHVVTLERLAASVEGKTNSKLPVLATVKPISAPVRQRAVNLSRNPSNGTAVEFIRGTRSETVHY